MYLVCISSIQLGRISTFWDRKVCMETWFRSKIFVSFTNFSCLIFFVQNVLIPLNCVLLRAKGKKCMQTRAFAIEWTKVSRKANDSAIKKGKVTQ